jgi:hypothetical protein
MRKMVEKSASQTLRVRSPPGWRPRRDEVEKAESERAKEPIEPLEELSALDDIG